LSNTSSRRSALKQSWPALEREVFDWLPVHGVEKEAQDRHDILRRGGIPGRPRHCGRRRRCRASAAVGRVPPEPSEAQQYIHLEEYIGYGIFQRMDIDPKELFAALAHDIRLRCLMLLMQHDELCVCELTYATGAPQPNISRHLAQLRELGLVSDRREGLWIHYRIGPQLPEWVKAVLQATAEGMTSQSPFASDKRTLSAMPNRPGTRRCA